ncbi:MAG: tRNA uridine-5-carboxymethylaminomethyl(34) synthesis GTPase MnmE [Desulfobulbaceae bacterium]|nr:tRNA uridine-5-carboxymethylaminomethyl(34) synthesis GTPase MnmE [Desulfobulbaceae bacterium]HIJ79265.1 tRNA uridine-5-carboxymethylaminomethyl(34) synthesis GTPase MnmE [Deltaproteobacteria bacterium]
MAKPDYNEATIAAIATPPGAGGIGIVRISGGQASPILHQIFIPRKHPANFLSHRLYYGTIRDPRTGMTVDEVLAVYMAAPHTYTREDVVEIHCHGSFIVLQQILALILSFSDTRPAESGEFTKRAFLNGRIDLTQAEAVADLLSAKTREGASLAVAQLQGGLQATVLKIRDALVAVRAIIEVAIDFPDEDVEILHPQVMDQQLRDEVISPLNALLARVDTGKLFRDGISVVIIGRPNVGKSSLLNTLLQEERSIVTEIAGTTRDTIEEYLDIRGIPVRIVDTAGIRDTSETVEEIGIQRARRKLEEADLVLLMVDGAVGLQNEDQRLYDEVVGKKIIVVVNKIDIAPEQDLSPWREAFAGSPLVAVSAKNQTGIIDLEQALFEMVTGGIALEESSQCAPNVRHASALQRAVVASQQVRQGLAADLPPDLLAIDLQVALDHLADIVGETTTEDVLDRIFAEFCIGK